MMKKIYFLALLAGGLAACKPKTAGPELPLFDQDLVVKVREAAAAIPGAQPVSINYLKYAASIRKWKDVIEDGSDEGCTMARTAFQLVYPDGTIMIDAGMDKQVQQFFEKDTGPQPFDDSAAAKVAQAVQQARLVLITHEHGDHVAGVIRNANTTLPHKTILTTEQAATLINNPQMPEIKLDEKASKQYIIADFASVLPVAPGVVLIKAPGHTAGEIMIYARLQNGREYIFAGDVSWCFRGVEEKKQKPKSESKRVGENRDAIEKELAWLNERLTKDKMTILVSHDDVMLPQLAAQGLIGKTLK